jgi:hypothetical protein
MGILCCFQSHADHAVPSSSAAASSSATTNIPERRPGDDKSSRNNNSVDYSNLVTLVNEIVADSGTQLIDR